MSDISTSNSSNEIYMNPNLSGENPLDIGNPLPSGELKTSNKVMRTITLGLQIISILAYYLPTIIAGGSFGLSWLIVGFVQTVLFSAVFFRDSKTRVKMSIAIMILATIFNFVMLLLIGFLVLLVSALGINLTAAIVYILCSMIAMIFALCFPRKYRRPEEEI